MALDILIPIIFCVFLTWFLVGASVYLGLTRISISSYPNTQIVGIMSMEDKFAYRTAVDWDLEMGIWWKTKGEDN